MFEFRVAQHLYEPGVKIFEVWDDGKFMATICPTETGIKIISKYLPFSLEEALKSVKIDCSEPLTTISVNPKT